MNQDKPMKHKYAEYIVAWANGEKVQFQTAQGTWESMDYFFSFYTWEDCPKDAQFRIKPKISHKYGRLVILNGKVTFDRYCRAPSNV